MVTISLCMIVKNEEKVLRRCLDSVKDLMDEIIIVDTGSTDRTKQIAKEYTEQIYDFQWTDDFSAARNFSFSKATKEYIYVADADEMLDEINRQRFSRLKEVLLPEIDIVQMLYCNQLQYNTTYNYDEEYRPKLYKRLRTFVWQEPIHEMVQIEPIIYDSDIQILHLPESNHGSRDFQNFQKMIARKEPISKRLHNMYARELYISGEKEDFLQAELFFLESVQEESRSLDEVKEASLVLAHIYRLKKDTVQFFKYVMKDIVTGSSSEACFELGMFYKDIEDYKEACNWFENARSETFPILNNKYGDELPKKELRECYEILRSKLKDEDRHLGQLYEELIEELEE